MLPRDKSAKTVEKVANDINPLTPEMEQQYETELCWCIQQLQIALKSGKLNNKQVQDHTKSLNTLMSNSAPFVKKRQIMRLSFGDYRTKMANEEKKYSKGALNMKVKQAVPSTKSIFVKQSNFASSGNNVLPNSSSSNADQLNNIQAVKTESVRNQTNLNFVSSDNSFRFSFDGEDP